MSEDKKLAAARNVFNVLCAAFDKNKLKYDIHEDDLVVTITMHGDDIPINVVMNVDANRGLIRLVSPLPVVFDDKSKLDGAIATGLINYSLIDGSFDFDYANGKVIFRMTSSFIESLISEDVFEYMLFVACHTVDDYNDKLLMLAKGKLPLSDFFPKG